MEVIWSLMLTVCSVDACASQSIQWFEQKLQCVEMQVLHEELPIDGDWSSVTYKCTVVGASEA